MWQNLVMMHTSNAVVVETSDVFATAVSSSRPSVMLHSRCRNHRMRSPRCARAGGRAARTQLCASTALPCSRRALSEGRCRGLPVRSRTRAAGATAGPSGWPRPSATPRAAWRRRRRLWARARAHPLTDNPSHHGDNYGYHAVKLWLKRSELVASNQDFYLFVTSPTVLP